MGKIGGEMGEPTPAGRTQGPADLEAVFAARPREWLRRVSGRETFAWPGAEGTVVAKRYAGLDLRDALRDVARLRRPRGSGRREGENLRELAACGVPVPRALGWWESRSGARSAVAMERVAHERTLRDLCREDARAAIERWLDPLAELVARLHSRGWYHRDLYLQHVAIARGERLVLLDVARARRGRSPRRRWFVKDLAALLHSAPRGPQGPQGLPGIGARACLRFLARYLDLRGVRSPSARRAFARAVLAKARRIAAHEPRRVDPRERGTGA